MCGPAVSEPRAGNLGADAWRTKANPNRALSNKRSWNTGRRIRDLPQDKTTRESLGEQHQIYFLGSCKFRFLNRCVLNNVTRNCARSHRKRRCQVHLSRPASTREISVLCADHDLIRTRRYSGPCIDARATTRFNYMCARFLKNFKEARALCVLSRRVRP